MVEERGYMLEECSCMLEVHIYMDGGAQLNAIGASLYAGCWSSAVICWRSRACTLLKLKLLDVMFDTQSHL